MNEAQVWTIIGVLAVADVAMLWLIPTLFVHTLRVAVGKVEAKIDLLRAEIRAIGAKLD